MPEPRRFPPPWFVKTSNGGNGSLNKTFRATPGLASMWQTPTTFLRPRNMAVTSSPTINGFSPEPAG